MQPFRRFSVKLRRDRDAKKAICVVFPNRLSCAFEQRIEAIKTGIMSEIAILQQLQLPDDAIAETHFSEGTAHDCPRSAGSRIQC
jgi:hypothetical protein